jgi:hypothetical protein
MQPSSIPRVKSALVTALESATWPGARPTVSWGWPRGDHREMVLVGDTLSSSQRWSHLGARLREEDYTLEVVISVLHPGDTQQEATERAFALLAVIEETLRSGPNLDLPGITFAEIADPDLAEAPADEGYAAVIVTGIHVTGRI